MLKPQAHPSLFDADLEILTQVKGNHQVYAVLFNVMTDMLIPAACLLAVWSLITFYIAIPGRLQDFQH